MQCFFLVVLLGFASWANAQSPRVPMDAPDAKFDTAAREKAKARQRRIIYNNDGGEPVMQMKNATKEEFLEARSNVLVNTQVDSIFYCSRTSGFGVFTHFTKIGQIYTCTEGRYAGNKMAELIKLGLDPLAMQVEFCRKNKIEIFWSLRMNDTHDGSKAEYGPILFKDNKLKNAHPEYLMGTISKPPKHGAWSAVNFGLPEVREFAYKYIEEVCQNYDVDGIELDFFRHPVFFKSTSKGEKATQAELDAMSDLMTRVRRMTEREGLKRGKPILVAVKLPDSIEYCKAIGLDLERWLEAGHIDLLIPGGYFQLNDWEYSVKLARKYGVKIYPSLDDTRVKDKDANALRATVAGMCGRASEAFAAGGDGVYYFNIFDNPDALKKQVNYSGDLKTLLTMEKDYFASPRGVSNAAGGNLPYATYQKIETLNPSNPKKLEPGKATVSRIHVGELNDKDTVTLRVQLAKAVDVKSLTAVWNGEKVELTVSDAKWYEAKLPTKSVKRGENRLELMSAVIAQWTDMLLRVH